MRFLQIGLGSMGKRRVRCIHALRAGEVIGYDSRADRREEAEQLYDIRTVSSFEAGLAADPDAVLIASPPHQHVEYGLAALAAGKPFFAEETVMLDPEALNPLIAESERSGLLAAPSCTMRFHPAAKEIRRVLEAGEIGPALSFNAHAVSYLPEWHPWEHVEDFYVRSRVSGGGREMVVFELDWLEWLFGRVTAVTADVSKISDIPADIDDTFHLLCRFASGVRGCLTSSVAYRVPGRILEICGQNGQIVWNNRDHRVMVYTAADGKWQHIMETASRDYGYDRMYVEELDHFLQAVRGEAAYVRNFRDVKRMLQVLTAVERSSIEGQRIAVG
jgi:predicted dehydrogenase